MKRLRSTDDDVRARLPLEDESVDRLDPKVRHLLARHWRDRATAELGVASVFAVIARELLETGADPAVLRIAARAVSDEVRHADICRLLSERYAGESVPWPAPAPAPLPVHAPAHELLRPTLHVVAMGCINETIASAWLERCQQDTTAPLPRAAIRELLADDVHHARLGWAHLASSFVPADVRPKIAAWLPRLLEAAAWPWIGDENGPPEVGVPEHGYPSGQTTRDVVAATVRDVILVGFAQLGVETAPARAWYMERFGGFDGPTAS